MQKYQQYCPVARASEIVADRWTPLILRELVLGSHRFNDIERGLPGISRSLLASRLRDLADAGVVERLPRAQSKIAEYHLAEAGRELKAVIEALGAWGVRWAFGEPRIDELDAGLLVWKIHQRIDRDLLPNHRVVVEFDFTGPRGRRVWLLLERHEASVCMTPPGFDADPSSARISPSLASGSGPSITPSPSDAAALSWRGCRRSRRSSRAGSCGARWRGSSANGTSAQIERRSSAFRCRGCRRQSLDAVESVPRYATTQAADRRHVT